MSVLQTQYIAYPAYDQPNSVPIGVLTFIPFYFFASPIYYPYAYGSQNPSASPLPLFPNDAAALAYYTADATSQLLANANASSAPGTYTSISLSALEPSEIVAFSTLTQDTIPDGTTYKKITATQQTKLNTLATVAVSGSYNDLTNQPTITAPKAYEGTTQRSGAFPIIKSATVASGVAVFHLTADGLSTGTALFPSGVIQDSVNLSVNDSSAAYQMSWTFSNSNKTLTVTTNKLTTANILTGILGQATGNGSVVKLQVWGY